MPEIDGFRDECGVAAVVGHDEAAHLTYLMLHALQHRGQESVGISTLEHGAMQTVRKMGRVAEVLGEKDLQGLPGRMSIGHVRYSTTGDSSPRNAQPIPVELRFGPVAFAHNGNLTNTQELKTALEADGSIFHTSSDTELFAHLSARSRASSIEGALMEAFSRVEGAYSLVVLTPDAVYAARDPMGVRPLVLGRLKDAWLVASETCALDLIRAEFVREIEPGETLRIGADGSLRSINAERRPEPAPCVFELVYFARPDSQLFGRSVYETRVELGRRLAEEHPVEADLVLPVPDSGVPAALGYAKASGIPFELGLVRSHYIGRTFIEPSQSIRHFGVKLKLNPITHLLKGKRVIVVDDSIVRGTTCRKIIKMIREAGATEVHFRVASPPTRWPCFYGIDTPRRRDLIAATHDLDEVARYITADSLGYVSLEGLRRACGLDAASERAGRRFCEACFTGAYPIPITESLEGKGPESGTPTPST